MVQIRGAEGGKRWKSVKREGRWGVSMAPASCGLEIWCSEDKVKDVEIFQQEVSSFVLFLKTDILQ